MHFSDSKFWRLFYAVIRKQSQNYSFAYRVGQNRSYFKECNSCIW